MHQDSKLTGMRASKVSSIYADVDPASMAVLQRRKKRSNRFGFFILVAVLALAAGAAWIGAMFLSPRANFTQSSIDLTFDASATAKIGEATDIKINYKNTDKSPVTDTTLTLTYPTIFSYKESTPSPANDQNNQFTIGTLHGGETGQIDLKGLIVGQSGQSGSIVAKLTYHPINLNTEFSLEKTFTFTITDSSIKLSLKGPSQASPGDQIGYQISYSDFSTLTNANLIAIRVVYPDGFTPNAWQPAPSVSPDTWKSSALLPIPVANNGTGTIDIKGSIDKSATTGGRFLVQLGSLDTNNTFTVYVESQQMLQLSRSDLGLTLNGSGDSAGTLNFVNPLKLTVGYENKGTNPISDASIVLQFTGDAWDWASIQADNGGRFTSGQVTWTSKEIPALTSLAPGQKGQTSVSLKTVDFSKVPELRSAGLLQKNQDVSLSAVANLSGTASSGTASSDSSTTTTTSSQPIQGKSGTLSYHLNTDTQLNGEARYFDANGQALGSGPLPPKVGSITKYRINFTVSNTLHELSNLTFRANLPSAVNWTNNSNVSAGTLTFDPKAQQVSWSLNRLPTQVEKATISFEVSLSPKKTDAKKMMLLISKPTLVTQDSVTKGNITVMSGDLTTNLENDTTAAGKGIVQP